MATDEFHPRRGRPHDLLPVAALDAVILPAERHGIGIGTDQAVVRDRHPVGVAAQVSQNRLRLPEGRKAALGHRSIAVAESGISLHRTSVRPAT